MTLATLQRPASALLLAAGLAIWVSPASAQVVPLGTAASFAVLAGSTITNTGPSIVDAHIGLAPGSAIIGFPPGFVNGTVHINTGPAVQAQADALVAFNQLAGLIPTEELTGQDLGSRTLGPGIYHFDTSAQLTGTLTLDGQGQVNPVFIFQMGSTLTTSNSAQVILINGANQYKIYWKVGSSTTIGTNASFVGTIISSANSTLNTGASLRGRIWSLNGHVALDSNIFDLNGTSCYANCDESTIAPILNVDDFTCFINNFAAAQSLPHAQQVPHDANCDSSIITPVLNVDDFTCFINAYAAGCR